MRTKKWLAALFAIMMVIAILPAAASAEGDGDNSSSTVTISNNEELVNAITNQQDGQTWVFTAAGVYDAKNTTEGSNGTYPVPEKVYSFPFALPIYVDNLTITKAEGVGDVTLTSSYVPDAANGGNWHNQDFITIFGSGVTIENIDLKANRNDYYGTCNKVVELTGSAKDFTLSNVDIIPLDDGEGTSFGGSIYFGVTDAGNTTITDVNMDAWISASNVTVGTITVTNLTQDFTNSSYAGYTYEGSYGWNPFVKGSQVTVDGYTIIVDDKTNLSEQIFNEDLRDGTTIQLMPGEYDVTTTGTNGQQGTGLILDQNDITLKAADPANKPVLYGFSTAANAGIVGGVNGQDTIYVSGQNVTLQDLKIMPLGGTGTNTADWQKTVEVVAGASGFTMTGCETLPNTKGENTMSNAAGLIHISTNDASVSGNSFGTGTTVCSGWSGSNESVPTGFYTVDASGNTWSDADIASHTDGIVVVDDSVYVNHEVALQQVIDDESLAGKTVVLAADLTLTDGIQITRPLTLDGNNRTVTCQGISTSVPAINGETMDYSAIIAATADATIQNLIIKGDPIEISKDSNLTHSTRYIGVAAIDANVTLEGCSIDSVTYNGDLQGMQNGFGVYAVSTSDKTLTMKDTTVTNFNKTGIVARDNIHVDMDGCNVIGFGPQAVIAQNGIQLEGSAVIQNSTFQDMSYTADNEWKYASTAIYSMGDAEDEVILDNVNCTNVDWSVTAYGGDVEIRSGVYECSPGCEAVWADEGVSMVVLGGTFATSPEDYLLKDSIVTEENGEYVVHTHTYGEEWKSDETNHWHECGACGAKADVAEHSFVWVTDKEATATEAGSKHQECSVCGYKLAAVEIPATGDNTGNTGDNTGNTGDNSATSGSNTNTNTNSSTSNAPKTGDTVNPMLWIALLAASTASLAGVIVYNKKRNTTR